MEYRLNFLLTQSEKGWVGRCLEYHFVTEADSLPRLMYELERAMVGHLVISQMQGVEPFSGLSRAPEPYWVQFRNAAAVVRLRDGLAQPEVPMMLPPHEVEEMRIADLVT